MPSCWNNALRDMPRLAAMISVITFKPAVNDIPVPDLVLIVLVCGVLLVILASLSGGAIGSSNHKDTNRCKNKSKLKIDTLFLSLRNGVLLTEAT